MKSPQGGHGSGPRHCIMVEIRLPSCLFHRPCKTTGTGDEDDVTLAVNHGLLDFRRLIDRIHGQNLIRKLPIDFLYHGR